MAACFILGSIRSIVFVRSLWVWVMDVITFQSLLLLGALLSLILSQWRLFFLLNDYKRFCVFYFLISISLSGCSFFNFRRSLSRVLKQRKSPGVIHGFKVVYMVSTWRHYYFSMWGQSISNFGKKEVCYKVNVIICIQGRKT